MSLLKTGCRYSSILLMRRFFLAQNVHPRIGAGFAISQLISGTCRWRRWKPARSWSTPARSRSTPARPWSRPAWPWLDAGEPQPERRSPQGRCTLSSMKQRQLVRQSLHFNKTGYAWLSAARPKLQEAQAHRQRDMEDLDTGGRPQGWFWKWDGNLQIIGKWGGDLPSPQELSRSRHLLFFLFVTRM